MGSSMQFAGVSSLDPSLGRVWDDVTQTLPIAAVPLPVVPLELLAGPRRREIGRNRGAATAEPRALIPEKRVAAGTTVLCRVGLLYDGRRAFDRRVMAGVAAWLKEHEGFCLHIADNSAPNPDSQDVDGVIANLDDPAVRSAVAASKLPVVGFGSGRHGWESRASVPYLFTSNTAIANLAADHFMSCSLSHFGFCGYARTDLNGWSGAREDAFVTRVAARGFTCHIGPAQRRVSAQSKLTDWLRSLPKPAGIMASDDIQARRILEACRATGIAVPKEIAVIGVDNDELLCELGLTTLTSVDPGAMQIGYRAAELLDCIMRGKRPKELNVAIEPVGIVGRRSTESAVVRDLVVEKAMAFIQDSISEGIRVRDVARAVAMSRSSLETRFRKEFGNTIRGIIRRVQMERAKRLVADSDLPLKQVAVSTGFRSVQHMTTLFRQAFGHPPAVYRHIARL